MKAKDKEVTIVSAYFDIGRGNYNQEFVRGNNKYIGYFKFWARIKNNLIVYTQKEFVDEIYEIRDSFGLKDKTKVIVIDDIYALLPEIYEKMKVVEGDNQYFKNYRYLKETPENKADYCYIMLLKTWCMRDAVMNGYVKTDIMAWLDFGFNHGGSVFTSEKDFDFLWKYPFSEKVYLSMIKEDVGKPIFAIVQNSEVYVQGSPFIVPVSKCFEFYDLIIKAMESLLDIGFMDDDQTLLLMAYRSKKELFNVSINDWLLFLKNYGAKHLHVRENSDSSVSLKDRLLYKYRVWKRNNNYLKGIKKIFLKDYLD